MFQFPGVLHSARTENGEPSTPYTYRPLEYLIRQYGLQQGALEIQYIEEFFLDFPRKKTAAEVVRRLGNRDHQILMAEAPLPDDPSAIVPVSFKVAHELEGGERSEARRPRRPARGRRRVRRTAHPVSVDWRTRSDGAGRATSALTEEQEVWAIENGFDEIIVKTKNRFYEMRSTLAQLRFDVVRFVPHPGDTCESKVFLRKRLGQHVLDAHRSRRSVTRVPA